MERKYGFIKMSLLEFKDWLKENRVGRTIISIQQHHTFSPSYSGFSGDNHFTLQKSMKNYHVNHNGWSNIGQHFTTFPDGSVLSGRSMEISPAGIYGSNSNSICIEHLGNFDQNQDVMNDAQQKTVIEMTAALCAKFNIQSNTNGILYHHWFNLASGERNNGTGGNKSCPGTIFFGGNKLENCQQEFIPRVEESIETQTPAGTPPTILMYASVTANRLNIRIGPSISFDKVQNRSQLRLGAILRVYDKKDNWFRISSSQDHWVSARYTKAVKKGAVMVTMLNAYSGPGSDFGVIGSYLLGQEIFYESVQDGWCKIHLEDKWISKSFLGI